MISRKLACGYVGLDNCGLTANGTHFEPQRTSVRASRLGISCESGPHAIALRLKIYKVSTIGR